MEWWQQLVAYVIIGFGGVSLGAWLQRRALREERLVREETELRSATRNLLAEVNANLELIEKPLKDWSLAPFATDMWNVHKGKITYLPPELQGDLLQAYLWIGKANAVVQTHLAHDSRGGGHFDSLYQQMVEEIRGPAQKARDGLVRWLEHNRLIEPRSSKPREGGFLAEFGVGAAISGVGFSFLVGVGLISPKVLIPCGVILVIVGIVFIVHAISRLRH